MSSFLVRFVCSCCDTSKQIIVSSECPAILAEAWGHKPNRPSTTTVVENLAIRGVSNLGWLLLKDEHGHADWLCRTCVADVTDPHSKPFVAATARWLQWTGISYEVAPEQRS